MAETPAAPPNPGALAMTSPHGPLRVGIGGPVGAGKTALMEGLCKRFHGHYNLAAIETMNRRFPGLDLILVESGGDNLAATFSPELADLTIYVIDVAGGEKIPRKGGPGITRSDLLVVNKIDLAPYVGADLVIMEEDARRMRGQRPYVFSNIRGGVGVEAIARFIEHAGGLP